MAVSSVEAVAPPPYGTSAGSGYVTDGARLFRVVAPLDPELGIRSAVLEDCVTLKWRVVRATELYRLHLRSVRPRNDGS